MKKIHNRTKLLESCWELAKNDHIMTREEIDEYDPYLWDEDISDTLLRESNSFALTEATSNISAGDIVLVSEFDDVTGDTSVTVDNREHRVLVLFIDKKNNEKNTTYFGRVFTSNIAKSNKFKPEHYSQIYIDDYDTILKNGIKSGHKQVSISLSTICSFNGSKIIKKIGTQTSA